MRQVFLKILSLINLPLDCVYVVVLNIEGASYQTDPSTPSGSDPSWTNSFTFNSKLPKVIQFVVMKKVNEELIKVGEIDYNLQERHEEASEWIESPEFHLQISFKTSEWSGAHPLNHPVPSHPTRKFTNRTISAPSKHRQTKRSVPEEERKRRRKVLRTNDELETVHGADYSDTEDTEEVSERSEGYGSSPALPPIPVQEAIDEAFQILLSSFPPGHQLEAVTDVNVKWKTICENSSKKKKNLPDTTEEYWVDGLQHCPDRDFFKKFELAIGKNGPNWRNKVCRLFALERMVVIIADQVLHSQLPVEAVSFIGQIMKCFDLLLLTKASVLHLLSKKSSNEFPKRINEVFNNNVIPSLFVLLFKRIEIDNNLKKTALKVLSFLTLASEEGYSRVLKAITFQPILLINSASPLTDFVNLLNDNEVDIHLKEHCLMFLNILISATPNLYNRQTIRIELNKLNIQKILQLIGDRSSSTVLRAQKEIYCRLELKDEKLRAIIYAKKKPTKHKEQDFRSSLTSLINTHHGKLSLTKIFKELFDLYQNRSPESFRATFLLIEQSVKELLSADPEFYSESSNWLGSSDVSTTEKVFSSLSLFPSQLIACIAVKENNFLSRRIANIESEAKQLESETKFFRNYLINFITQEPSTPNYSSLGEEVEAILTEIERKYGKVMKKSHTANSSKRIPAEPVTVSPKRKPITRPKTPATAPKPRRITSALTLSSSFQEVEPSPFPPPPLFLHPIPDGDLPDLPEHLPPFPDPLTTTIKEEKATRSTTTDTEGTDEEENEDNWQYKDSEKWVNFDKQANKDIENAWKKGDKIIILKTGPYEKENHELFLRDVPEMFQKNMATGNTSSIRRLPEVKVQSYTTETPPSNRFTPFAFRHKNTGRSKALRKVMESFGEKNENTPKPRKERSDEGSESLGSCDMTEDSFSEQTEKSENVSDLFEKSSNLDYRLINQGSLLLQTDFHENLDHFEQGIKMKASLIEGQKLKPEELKETIKQLSQENLELSKTRRPSAPLVNKEKRSSLYERSRSLPSRPSKRGVRVKNSPGSEKKKPTDRLKKSRQDNAIAGDIPTIPSSSTLSTVPSTATLKQSLIPSINVIPLPKNIIEGSLFNRAGDIENISFDVSTLVDLFSLEHHIEKFSILSPNMRETVISFLSCSGVSLSVQKHMLISSSLPSLSETMESSPSSSPRLRAPAIVTTRSGGELEKRKPEEEEEEEWADSIVTAIKEGNFEFFNKEKYYTMKSWIPFILQLKELDFTPFPLDIPSQFLVKLSQIPYISVRIDLMLFFERFQHKISKLRLNLSNLLLACQIISHRKQFKLLFKLLLKLGNSLNRGKKWIGNTKGFRIGSFVEFCKLEPNTEATEKEHPNLMDYFVKNVEGTFPQLLEFGNISQQFNEVSNIKLKIVRKNFEKLLSKLKSIEQSSAPILTQNDETDPSIARSVALFNEYKVEVRQVEDILLKVEAEYSSLCRYYGEPNTDTDAFFKIFHQLIESIQSYKTTKGGQLVGVPFEKLTSQFQRKVHLNTPLDDYLKCISVG